MADMRYVQKYVLPESQRHVANRPTNPQTEAIAKRATTNAITLTSFRASLHLHLSSSPSKSPGDVSQNCCMASYQDRKRTAPFNPSMRRLYASRHRAEGCRRFASRAGAACSCYGPRTSTNRPDTADSLRLERGSVSISKVARPSNWWSALVRTKAPTGEAVE